MSDPVRQHNRKAWDNYAEQGNPWSKPVSSEEVAAARQGDLRIFLTEHVRVPPEWYLPLEGKNILCLASGGGQQAPLLAAAGAKVVSFDNSPRQLELDAKVAEREGLELQTLEGDMCDLSVFPDGRFDLIFHPVSNLFVPDVHPVWRECYRVLRNGGVLLAGFLNPVEYIFDHDSLDQRGELHARFALPYSDLQSINQEERERMYGADSALEWSHTLTDQIGGQLQVGFHLVGFYESERNDSPIAKYFPSYIATKALKPR